METSGVQQPDGWCRDVVARFVLRARRRADLSQRDLAGRIGASQATVNRLESGSCEVGVERFAQILALAGLHLAVVDTEGAPVAPFPPGTVRDNADRRMPSHLDVGPPDEVPRERWAFPRYDRLEARAWYHHRTERDRLRAGPAGASGEPTVAAGPSDHPTVTELARRRRLMRGRQPRVEAPPLVLPECRCPDECFIAPACLPVCSCQCEPPNAWTPLRRRLAERDPSGGVRAHSPNDDVPPAG